MNAIEAAAMSLSHLNGNFTVTAPGGFDVDNYDGTEDVAIDFGGARKHNISDVSTQNRMPLKIRNTHPTETLFFDIWGGYETVKKVLKPFREGVKIAIAAGQPVPLGELIILEQYKFAPGLMQTGQFADLENKGFTTGGGQYQGLTASVNGGKPIEDFFYSLMENPSYISGIDLDASDALQLNNPIRVMEKTPFRASSDKVFVFSEFRDQNTIRDKTIKVKLDGDQRIFLTPNWGVQYSINPNTTVDLTLYLGASVNQGKALEKKVYIAEGNKFRRRR